MESSFVLNLVGSPVESSGVQFCVSKSKGVQWSPVLCHYTVDSPVESSGVQFCLELVGSPVESSGVHVDYVGEGKVLSLVT